MCFMCIATDIAKILRWGPLAEAAGGKKCVAVIWNKMNKMTVWLVDDRAKQHSSADNLSIKGW